MSNEKSKLENAKYIVFGIDSKYKDHDGKIFCNFKDAKLYAIECIEENYCDKVIVGFFCYDKNDKEMYISCIETIGFSKDKKNVEQLNLFTKKKLTECQEPIL